MTRFRVHVEYSETPDGPLFKATKDEVAEHPDHARQQARNYFTNFIARNGGSGVVYVKKTKRLLKVGA